MGMSQLAFAKSQFATLLNEVQPVVAQFIVWLDEKVAEYKVQGYMNLDSGLDAPQWIKDYSMSLLVSGLAGQATHATATQSRSVSNPAGQDSPHAPSRQTHNASPHPRSRQTQDASALIEWHSPINSYSTNKDDEQSPLHIRKKMRIHSQDKDVSRKRLHESSSRHSVSETTQIKEHDILHIKEEVNNGHTADDDYGPDLVITDPCEDSVNSEHSTKLQAWNTLGHRRESELGTVKDEAHGATCRVDDLACSTEDLDMSTERSILMGQTSSGGQDLQIGGAPIQHTCCYCDQIFSTPSDLTLHMDQHEIERPYKCRFCDKRFKQGAHRVNHERIHTGERPFHCRYCEKSFGRKFVCEAHEMSHFRNSDSQI